MRYAKFGDSCISQYIIDRIIIENLYRKTNQFFCLAETITDKIVKGDSLTEIYSLILEFIELCIYDCVPLLLVEEKGEIIPFISINNLHHDEFIDLIRSYKSELVELLNKEHTTRFSIDELDINDNDSLKRNLFAINIRSILSIPIVQNQEEPKVYLLVLFPYTRKDCIYLNNYLNIATNLLKIAIEKTNSLNKFVKIIEEKDEIIKIKVELLSYISHEIRNLMNAIVSMVDMLFEMDLNTQIKDYLMLIRNSTDSTIALLNEIIELARLEYGKIELEEEEINLQDLAKEIVKMFEFKANRKGLKLYYYLSNDLPLYVLGDKRRINQILINLISNAIKFTNNGEVSISVQKCNKTGNILFSISDTGMGIPKDKMNLIFEKFTQADTNITKLYGGGGLGLSISLNLVKIMNGDIWVESEEDKGSTFFVSLPLKSINKSKTRESEKPLNNHSFNLSGIKILIVDDVPLNQLFLKRILEKNNLFVKTANNGEEAIEILKKEHFDLVFMDVYMPKLNGVEATKRIRKGETLNSNIPIIALTAGVDDKEKNECLNAGMNEFITKPVKIDSLFSVILKFCSSTNN